MAIAFVFGIFGLLASEAPAATGHVYWVTDSAGSLGRADTDGTNVNQTFISIFSNPGRVAVDDGHLYWATPDADAITRADLDGSNVDAEFIHTGSYPEGLTVYGGRIYWTNERDGTIGGANVDGSGVQQVIVTTGGFPRGLTAAAGGLYWTDQVDHIGHAGLDGSNPDPDFISTGSNPQDVVVDGSHIYWTNADAKTIGRANLDGSGADQSFIAGLSSPWGLAIDAGHLYWTNAYNAGIGRAALDGSDVRDSFITTLAGPSGVAVLAGTDSGDTTAPTTTIALTPATPNGSGGWYRTAVGVHVSATDDTAVAETRCAVDPATPPTSFASLPAGACSLTSITAAGTHTVWAASTDAAGNAETPVSTAVKIDATAPVVTWAAHPASYTVEQTVTIGCTAADPSPGSGLASSTCAQSGLNAVPAYTLGPGAHTLSASAGDVAGNTGTAQTQYSVTVTAASLCTLTQHLVQGSVRYQALPALARAIANLALNASCRVVQAIEPRLSARAKAIQVAAYRSSLVTLTNQGWLTAAQAAALTALAEGI